MNTTQRTVGLIVSLVLAKSDEERNEIIRELREIEDERNSTTDDSLQTITEDLLAELGIPCHILGFAYIVTATCALAEDERLGRKLVDGLYADVARAHNTTGSRVERAIRHAVEVSWDRCDIDKIHCFFGNTVSPTKGKPTNGEFIWRVAREVKRREQAQKR